MDIMFWALIGAVIALVFAAVAASGVLKKSEGSEKIKKIAGAIRRGANAYLKRQYKTVAIFFVIVTIVLAILAATGFMTFFVPIAFIVGGVFSALAGFHRYENRHGGEFPYGHGRDEEPQFGAARFVLFGRGYGDDGRRPRPSVSHDLVFYTKRVFCGRYGADREQHADVRHGRFVHGAVRACGRRYLHQSG